MKDLRGFLEDVEQGREGASEELTALLYEELRAIAERRMEHERPGHTLQPTALAHEALLRVAKGGDDSFDGRVTFLAAVAVASRRVLVEHARRRARLKRGGDRERVDLELAETTGHVPDEALLDLDDALRRLAELWPAHAHTVELRFFGGLSERDIAAKHGVSESTVRRRWRFARAWLRGELGEEDAS